jgi:DNA-binding GntR family transcriptional regulator
VAAHLRQMIFDGELRQGERVRQDEIAEELGVSRIPVREAIIALDREGWVTIEPHRGAFVQGLDEATVRDHYELLGLVYGLAARRAAERGSADGVARLRELQREVAAADDVDDFYRRNEAFLRHLVDLAGSGRVSAVLRVMPSIIPGNFFAHVPASLEVQRKGAAAIARAVRAGDGEKAAEVCVRLLRSHGDNVVRVLEDQHIFATPPAD